MQPRSNYRHRYNREAGDRDMQPGQRNARYSHSSSSSHSPIDSRRGGLYAADRQPSPPPALPYMSSRHANSRRSDDRVALKSPERTVSPIVGWEMENPDQRHRPFLQGRHSDPSSRRNQESSPRIEQSAHKDFHSPSGEHRSAVAMRYPPHGEWRHPNGTRSSRGPCEAEPEASCEYRKPILDYPYARNQSPWEDSGSARGAGHSSRGVRHSSRSDRPTSGTERAVSYGTHRSSPGEFASRSSSLSKSYEAVSMPELRSSVPPVRTQDEMYSSKGDRDMKRNPADGILSTNSVLHDRLPTSGSRTSNELTSAVGSVSRSSETKHGDHLVRKSELVLKDPRPAAYNRSREQQLVKDDSGRPSEPDSGRPPEPGCLARGRSGSIDGIQLDGLSRQAIGEAGSKGLVSGRGVQKQPLSPKDGAVSTADGSSNNKLIDQPSGKTSKPDLPACGKDTGRSIAADSQTPSQMVNRTGANTKTISSPLRAVVSQPSLCHENGQQPKVPEPVTRAWQQPRSGNHPVPRNGPLEGLLPPPITTQLDLRTGQGPKLRPCWGNPRLQTASLPNRPPSQHMSLTTVSGQTMGSPAQRMQVSYADLEQLESGYKAAVNVGREALSGVEKVTTPQVKAILNPEVVLETGTSGITTQSKTAVLVATTSSGPLQSKKHSTSSPAKTDVAAPNAALSIAETPVRKQSLDVLKVGEPAATSGLKTALPTKNNAIAPRSVLNPVADLLVQKQVSAATKAVEQVAETNIKTVLPAMGDAATPKPSPNTSGLPVPKQSEGVPKSVQTAATTGIKITLPTGNDAIASTAALSTSADPVLQKLAPAAAKAVDAVTSKPLPNITTDPPAQKENTSVAKTIQQVGKPGVKSSLLTKSGEAAPNSSSSTSANVAVGQQALLEPTGVRKICATESQATIPENSDDTRPKATLSGSSDLPAQKQASAASKSIEHVGGTGLRTSLPTKSNATAPVASPVVSSLQKQGPDEPKSVRQVAKPGIKSTPAPSEQPKIVSTKSSEALPKAHTNPTASLLIQKQASVLSKPVHAIAVTGVRSILPANSSGGISKGSPTVSVDLSIQKQGLVEQKVAQVAGTVTTTRLLQDNGWMSPAATSKATSGFPAKSLDTKASGKVPMPLPTGITAADKQLSESSNSKTLIERSDQQESTQLQELQQPLVLPMTQHSLSELSPVPLLAPELQPTPPLPQQPLSSCANTLTPPPLSLQQPPQQRLPEFPPPRVLQRPAGLPHPPSPTLPQQPSLLPEQPMEPSLSQMEPTSLTPVEPTSLTLSRQSTLSFLAPLPQLEVVAPVPGPADKENTGIASSGSPKEIVLPASRGHKHVVAAKISPMPSTSARSHCTDSTAEEADVKASSTPSQVEHNESDTGCPASSSPRISQRQQKAEESSISGSPRKLFEACELNIDLSAPNTTAHVPEDSSFLPLPSDQPVKGSHPCRSPHSSDAVASAPSASDSGQPQAAAFAMAAELIDKKHHLLSEESESPHEPASKEPKLEQASHELCIQSNAVTEVVPAVSSAQGRACGAACSERLPLVSVQQDPELQQHPDRPVEQSNSELASPSLVVPDTASVGVDRVNPSGIISGSHALVDILNLPHERLKEMLISTLQNLVDQGEGPYTGLKQEVTQLHIQNVRLKRKAQQLEVELAVARKQLREVMRNVEDSAGVAAASTKWRPHTRTVGTQIRTCAPPQLLSNAIRGLSGAVSGTQTVATAHISSGTHSRLEDQLTSSPSSAIFVKPRSAAGSSQNILRHAHGHEGIVDLTTEDNTTSLQMAPTCQLTNTGAPAATASVTKKSLQIFPASCDASDVAQGSTAICPAGTFFNDVGRSMPVNAASAAAVMVVTPAAGGPHVAVISGAGPALVASGNTLPSMPSSIEATVNASFSGHSPGVMQRPGGPIPIAAKQVSTMQLMSTGRLPDSPDLQTAKSLAGKRSFSTAMNTRQPAAVSSGCKLVALSRSHRQLPRDESMIQLSHPGLLLSVNVSHAMPPGKDLQDCQASSGLSPSVEAANQVVALNDEPACKVHRLDTPGAAAAVLTSSSSQMDTSFAHSNISAARLDPERSESVLPRDIPAGSNSSLPAAIVPTARNQLGQHSAVRESGDIASSDTLKAQSATIGSCSLPAALPAVVSECCNEEVQPSSQPSPLVQRLAPIMPRADLSDQPHSPASPETSEGVLMDLTTSSCADATTQMQTPAVSAHSEITNTSSSALPLESDSGNPVKHIGEVSEAQNQQHRSPVTAGLTAVMQTGVPSGTEAPSQCEVVSPMPLTTAGGNSPRPLAEAGAAPCPELDSKALLPLPRAPAHVMLAAPQTGDMLVSAELSPPPPLLQLTRGNSVIQLLWNMELTTRHSKILKYELFAYHDQPGLLSHTQWSKIGDIPALPLPMSCSLSQFTKSDTYHFSIRAIDRYGRVGPFSIPKTIDIA